MTGRADYYEDGGWNTVCYECGRKRKAGTLKRHWQGYYVCPEHWEPRQPQDFVRSILDNQTPEWVQPMPPPLFVPTDYAQALSDSLPLEEAVAIAFTRTPFTDVAALTEAVSLGPNVQPAESFTFTEARWAAFTKAISEALPLSETVFEEEARVLIESLAATEVISYTTVKAVLEAFALTEGVFYYLQSQTGINDAAINSTTLG